MANNNLNLIKFLIPLLLLIAAFFVWRSCGGGMPADNTLDTIENMASETVDAAGASAEAIVDAAGDAVDRAGNVADDFVDSAGDAIDATGDAITKLGQFFTRKIARGIELNIPENGIENKLIDFLESDPVIDKTTWFEFDRLTFQPGGDQLDLRKSKEQLGNISHIMNAYPNITIKVGGYTDNTGNPEANQKLSQARADNVKAVLVQIGTKADRIFAEGYGEAHPVASNDTPEGRAKNRRIALRVRSK